MSVEVNIVFLYRLGVGTNMKELWPDCLIFFFFYEIGARSYLESEEDIS